MAPVEDNDSGMESQDGSQSLDQEETEKEFTSKGKKQPEIESGDDDDEVTI